MASFTAAYAPMVSAQAMIAQGGGPGGQRSGSRWEQKPKYSASPMEKLDPAARGNSEYLCPRCREGRLRRIQGKNGSFWGCTNYPQCTATFDDQRGKPLLQ